MLQGMDYVYAVWRERSFSAAARKLFVSQPALSASVKKVEAAAQAVDVTNHFQIN